ncbi:MAG: acyl--CoA ligase [Pseudomonadales bacterium]|nr:acyl--CoA ligase [Pseudomonadales bacterium]
MSIEAFNELIARDKQTVLFKELYLDTGVVIAYSLSDFLNRVDAALMLISSNESLQKAERVLLYSEDTYKFATAFVALSLTGKNIVLPQNQTEGALRHAAAFVDAILLDDISESLVEQCAQQDLLFKLPPKLTHQDSVISDLRNEKFLFSGCSIAVTIFTSGSTGAPKAITKDIGCFLEEVKVLESLFGVQLSDAEIIATVSHQHVYGLLFKLLWPLLTGRIIWLNQMHFPEEIFALLSRVEKAALVSSPAFLSRVTQQSWCPENVSLSQIFSSGGPLRTEDNFANQAVGRTGVTEILGSSETGGVAFRSKTQKDNSDIWVPLPLVQVTESKEGQLLVKSPFVYTDDWFQMGDNVTQLSSDGFVLGGRSDRVVKIEEKRISLDELETRLARCPEVTLSRLLVLPGKRLQVGAVVVLSDLGTEKLESSGKLALTKLLRAYLSDYFELIVLPRKWRFVDSIDMNAQGKISTTVLEKLFDS